MSKVVPVERRLYVTVEETPFALEQHVAAWHALVEHAAEPNPFYEPHTLLPAWRHLAPPGLRVVLVWAPNVLPNQPPHLAGLFPIIRRDRYKGFPTPVFATWQHLYSYLATPLVHIELATLVLQTFLGWLRTESDAALFECHAIRSGGAFDHAMIDTLNALGYEAFRATVHTRAAFVPAASADAYFEHSLSGKKRKELRRQERRLGELGTIAYDETTGDLDAWIDEFVSLEATGWKGKGGTALRDDPAALAMFRAYAHGAHARGRWMAMALRLDRRAIAMKCNLLAGTGAIAFKIAYDESFARFSPGVLLEVEHVRLLHERRTPAWMDSGAAADHPMIGHLWRDRIAIETLVVPTGRAPGLLAVAALPLLRWGSRSVKRLLQSRKP
ncbi:MAG: GNAT family N-acetyltransferase [Kofleriaceae bacterium]